MNYLFDANSLITPHRNYYPHELFPSFWDWLENLFIQNSFLIDKVYKELTYDKNDFLCAWVNNIISQSDAVIKTNTPEIITNYGLVMNYVKSYEYYTDASFKSWADFDKADPFLIATAIDKNAIIVTEEKFITLNSPTKSEPKIPNVAKYFGIKCISLIQFLQLNNFNL